MSARSPRWVVLAVLSAITACTYVEIDEPSVCETLSDATVAGLPVDAGVQTVVVPLGLNIHKALGTPTNDGSVQFTSLDVTAVSGISSFAFVQSAELDLVVSGGEAGTIVPVGTYQAEAGAPPSSILSLTGNGANVFPYVKTGAINLSLRIVGTPPAEAWSFTSDACVHIAVQE